MENDRKHLFQQTQIAEQCVSGKTDDDAEDAALIRLIRERSSKPASQRISMSFEELTSRHPEQK